MERFEAYDENGKKIIFELVETFGMNDSEYAVLNSEDDVNTYILKIIYDKDGKIIWKQLYKNGEEVIK